MLTAKFRELLPHLDERTQRLVLGAEARALGHGGIGLVAEAAGVSRGRVSRGAGEVAAGTRQPGRVRRPGGGRKRVIEVDAGLAPALMGLVEPGERGDPMSPLRWTTKSLRHLADQLTRAGHRVGRDIVADLLHANGFSLQGVSRTLEGIRHPDRDGQFWYISELVAAFQRAGQPVVSVDAKKPRRRSRSATSTSRAASGARPGSRSVSARTTSGSTDASVGMIMWLGRGAWAQAAAGELDHRDEGLGAVEAVSAAGQDGDVGVGVLGKSAGHTVVEGVGDQVLEAA